MKKIISILIVIMVVLMLFSFASCGENKDTDVAKLFTETVDVNKDKCYVLNGGLSYGDSRLDVIETFENTGHPFEKSGTRLKQNLEVKLDGKTFEAIKTYYFDNTEGLFEIKIFFDALSDKDVKNIYNSLKKEGTAYFGKPIWNGDVSKTIRKYALEEYDVEPEDIAVKWGSEDDDENTVAFSAYKLSKGYSLTIWFNPDYYFDFLDNIT